MKRPGGSRADRHIRFGVSHDTIVLPKLLGDRLPQFGQAIESRVDILPVLHRLCPGPKHYRWNRGIADPLCHIESLRLGTGWVIARISEWANAAIRWLRCRAIGVSLPDQCVSLVADRFQIGQAFFLGRTRKR